MRLQFRILFFLLVTFVALRVTAQQKQDYLLDAIAKQEQNNGVRFFYRLTWLKDLKLDQERANLPLNDFLNLLQNQFQLSHRIYKDKYIILFKTSGTEKPAISENEQLSEATFKPDGKEYSISGYVEDAKTGEKLVGATVMIEELKTGVVTNAAGFYSITLPSAIYNIRISAVGQSTVNQRVVLSKNLELNIELFDQVTQLNDIEIRAEALDRNITSIEIGTVNLGVKNIKSIPAFLGEPDIIKSVTMLPGVKTVGDGASGFNVRGGNVDQNLVLLDDVPMFNTAHLFGFFSAFNTDAIKDVTLSKGGMSASYGGRIASVLDVKLKEGNKRNLVVEGGIGLISSRLSLEGPIVKDKTSFIVSGRTAYPDWIFNQVPDLNIRNSSGYFDDVTARLHHKVNEKHTLSLSGYSSRDAFKFAGDTSYNWSTKSATLRWTSTLSKKLFMSISAFTSQYNYSIEGLSKPDSFEAAFGLATNGAKADFSFFGSPRSKFDFGVSAHHYTFNPGELLSDEGSAVNPVKLPLERSVESAAYINNEFKLNNVISFSLGLRYSYYLTYGAADVRLYQEGQARRLSTVVDTLSFLNNDVIKTYDGLEPRASIKIAINDQSSIKVGYNKNIQYIHLISNTAAVSPLDIWKSSDYHIKPQIGQQVSVGYFRNFISNTLEASAELYYKEVNNMLDYKDGAELFLNSSIETAVLSSFARAYGAELLIRKNSGSLTGWVGYTYSRTLRQAKSIHAEETINKGAFYPANFDKPHDFTTVFNYKFTRRLSMSGNFTYSTGRPITYPNAVYLVDGYSVVQFSDRNTARIPDYHRLDLSLTLESSLRKTKKWRGSWTLSIFNVYGRRNPFSVFFKPEFRGAQPQAYQLSVLGTAFPSLSYNFKIN